MSESTKYDFFNDELNSLEKQIYSYLQKSEELEEENEVLLNKVKNLDKENEVLKLKLEEVDTKLSNFQENMSLNNNDIISTEDKEELKSKISDLISKIDYHLRS